MHIRWVSGSPTPLQKDACMAVLTQINNTPSIINGSVQVSAVGSSNSIAFGRAILWTHVNARIRVRVET